MPAKRLRGGADPEQDDAAELHDDPRILARAWFDRRRPRWAGQSVGDDGYDNFDTNSEREAFFNE